MSTSDDIEHSDWTKRWWPPMKNVATLTRRAQLRAQIEYANHHGMRYHLFVRSNTVISPRLMQYLRQHNVTVRRVLNANGSGF
ncbi:putative toxin [Aquisalimonas sp.]|uniref:putative toxin n=1 Tax=Aquisalimonas sp. TaxID=1872621 RepID=UPI003456BB52